MLGIDRGNPKPYILIGQYIALDIGMVNIELMRSKVFQTTPNSPSLRATIPLGIAQTLKLSHGDELEWEIEARNGSIVVIVRKVVE